MHPEHEPSPPQNPLERMLLQYLILGGVALGLWQLLPFPWKYLSLAPAGYLLYVLARSAMKNF